MYGDSESWIGYGAKTWLAEKWVGWGNAGDCFEWCKNEIQFIGRCGETRDTHACEYSGDSGICYVYDATAIIGSHEEYSLNRANNRGLKYTSICWIFPSSNIQFYPCS